MIFIIIILLIVLLIILFKNNKVYQEGCVNFVTGSVKSGKTLFCVDRCIYLVKKRRFIIFLKNIFRSKKNKLQYPLLYSNIPIKCKYYVPLSKEVITRKYNVIPYSVVLIDEASLLADSMSYNDKLLNEQLTLFIKLFGHSSHNGIMYINSQDLKDVHFGIKRSVSSLYYIQERKKILFFTIFKFRRLESIVDDNVIVEDEVYTKFILNSNYKKYDCFCYSILTDENVIDDRVIENVESLKQDKIVSFRKFNTFDNHDS